MSDNDVLALARQINEKDNDPTGGLRLRRGVVTVVNRANNTYTLTIGGASIAGVPAQSHVYAQVNDVVDVLLDGPASRIIGVTGLANGLPDTNSYMTASTLGAQAIATNIWTRLTLAFEEGNSGNFDGTQSWYVIPNSGLYLVEGRARVADGSTAGINIGLSVSVDDGGANDVWNSIPTTGAARRLILENVRVARYTAGQQIRLTVYPDGGAVTMINRRLSVVRLGV